MEQHQLPVPAPPEAALAALTGVPLTDLRATRALLFLRGLRFDRQATLRQFFTAPPFLLLAEVPGREVVFGVLRPVAAPDGTRRLPSTPTEFAEAAARAPLAAVVCFRAEPEPGGARLWTETFARTHGTRAGLQFAVYWLAVGPWSAWMRRMFLRAGRTRAIGG